MTAEIAQINDKLDALTQQVAYQQERLAHIDISENGDKIGELHRKVDVLIDHFESQRRRQQEFEELKNDLFPIVNHMIKLSIDELAEIGTEFQMEDLLFLFKRLLRDTHILIDLLDRVESTVELIDEAKIIGKQVFNQTVVSLDRLEREGYLNFARSVTYIFERIVTEFSEEDVKLLGDNIVTILKTVRNLTQPEFMELTNNALQAFQDEAPPDSSASPLALLRELSDPSVRKGLHRMLNLVKSLADQPISKN